ncbi:MOSC domain-containing protein [Spartinivicinus poritis]|uniref:MOSC domain-containing protein n=1 Tax=Spartinivicinus poritis TaxID=2994640 RepID=A0ABT5UDT0_9GAMM|nr:MOSC domain-containing protein [Spartinivicinus sp. A2-2]MDE1464527.1 MOSC domain-containing protein [Spartinivicinus sp. A2-2]
MDDKNKLPKIILEEVRTGTPSLLGHSGIKSAIDKKTTDHTIRITSLGIEGDVQVDLAYHGGPDRAILHYNRDHYVHWKQDLPNSADYFVAGGFGENFVTSGLSEREICIGDKVAVGSAILEVSQFRQPCFKLNHRFHNKGMSRRTQATGRTGWFYRVLQEGEIKAGDTLEIIERPLPEWSISRLQHYVYDGADDLNMAKTLSTLPYLGSEIRSVFEKRVTTKSVEDWNHRLSNGALAKIGTTWSELTITDAEFLTPVVRRLRFERADGGPVPDFTAGAHIDIKPDNSLTRSYSLIHLPDGKGYEIAVKREPESRGGSAWVHDTTNVGDQLMVAMPTNFFPLSDDAKHNILIAGGIGVTPLLCMIEQLEESSAEWELHYCARFKDNAPYSDLLKENYPGRVHIYLSDEDPDARLDIKALLEEVREGTHIYCCGPKGLMDAVQMFSAHWPSGTAHFEAFTAGSAFDNQDNNSFEVIIESSGEQIKVSSEATLLEALRDAGLTVESNCESGTCGTCRINYENGDIEHRDMVLTPDERENTMMCCVSRAKGNVTLKL